VRGKSGYWRVGIEGLLKGGWRRELGVEKG